MKALTVWQPWASLILIGAKSFEFRKWPAPAWVVGQRIAIHAGKRPMRRREVLALLESLRGGDLWHACLTAELAIPFLDRALNEPGIVPHSAVLCTARLGAPRDGFEIAAEYGMPPHQRPNDSDRDDHANFGWPLTEIEPLIPPAECAGMQGFWTWGGTYGR